MTADTAQGELACLRDPETIRVRCRRVLVAGINGELTHFLVDQTRMPEVVDAVEAVTKAAYPDLNVPRHSRFNHFRAGGVDRVAELEPKLPTDPMERARCLMDLVVVSVLLDAGAGPEWRYHSIGDGRKYGRSEGLAVASFEAFSSGLFSKRSAEPLRADGQALAGLEPVVLGQCFQDGDGNRLKGLLGRAELLQRLGQRVTEGEAYFGQTQRVGGLVDTIVARSEGGKISTRVLLPFLLEALAPIWPSRNQIGEIELGDVWAHPKAGGEGATHGWLPLHKLSQWLCYSILEVLTIAGLEIVDEDALTGLAEYRNGGLFVDAGVLQPIDPRAFEVVHAPGSPFVVEWRALTVALLDKLAPLVNERFAARGVALSLGSILEGGTWAAGRKFAEKLRAGATPPFKIASDGTLF